MITDVVIAGGGPNGLMLACELSLAGVRPVVLERLPEPSEEPKANGLLGQVVKMVDRRGLYERLSGSPEPPQPNSAYFMFAAMGLDLSLLEDSPIYALPVPQRRIVQVLQERALELGVEIRRGHEVVGLSQDDDTVTTDVAGPDGAYQLRARYLVGADGAHSVTRKLSGIDFPGVTYDRMTLRSAHATVPATWVDPATGALNVPGYGAVLPFLPHRTEHGGFSYAPLPGHPPLVNVTEWDQPETDAPMSLDELRASIRRVLGVDVPLDPPGGEGPHVLRRLTGGNTRVAERFSDGRVFLIGDAAHVFAATAGGPGLNLGLQDAINLGWKLAAELRGSAPPGLLDSYENERRPVARRMVMNAQAQSVLIAPGSDVTGLRELFTELLRDRNTVQRLAELTAGADAATTWADPRRTRWSAGSPRTWNCTPERDGPAGGADQNRPASAARPDRGGIAGGDAVPAARPVDIVTARPDPHAHRTASPTGLLRGLGLRITPTRSRELETLRETMQRWFGVIDPPAPKGCEVE